MLNVDGARSITLPPEPYPAGLEHLFDTGRGSEAIADDPAARLDTELDTELEDAFAWAAIERDLRQGGEDRTFGNTSPSGFFALERGAWQGLPFAASPQAAS